MGVNLDNITTINSFYSEKAKSYTGILGKKCFTLINNVNPTGYTLIDSAFKTMVGAAILGPAIILMLGAFFLDAINLGTTSASNAYNYLTNRVGQKSVSNFVKGNKEYIVGTFILATLSVAAGYLYKDQIVEAGSAVYNKLAKLFNSSQPSAPKNSYMREASLLVVAGVFTAGGIFHKHKSKNSSNKVGLGSMNFNEYQSSSKFPLVDPENKSNQRPVASKED